MTRRSPASSCSGLSTGIPTIVVQLGLAMIPLGIEARAWALASGTTRGTWGSMRQAEEFSTTSLKALAGCPVELERRVQGLDGPLDVLGPHHTADADRGRGDHLDVHALVGEDLEHLGGHAGVGLHARADEADAGDLGVGD